MALITDKGRWNAFLNIPYIQNGIGNPGDTYTVGTEGYQNIGNGSVYYRTGMRITLGDDLIYTDITSDIAPTNPSVLFTKTVGSPTMIPVIQYNNSGIITNAYEVAMSSITDGILLTGDVSGISSGGVIPTTLANTGVTAGSYSNANIIIDSKGRITSASNGSASAVTSIFGRTGDVTASSSDYSAYYPMLSDSYANPTWITSLIWSKITSTPTSLSGYGITDPIVLTSGSYSNPTWITSLSWLKITGAPSFIALTALSGTYPITYNNTTGVIGITQSTTSTPGYLSSTDWNTFNGKQAALSGSGVVKSTSGTISYVSGTSSQFIKGDGSLDSSSYITSNQTITLSGGATGSGTTAITVTLSNSAVTSQPITGFSAGAGTVTATDTILQAIQKIVGNVSALTGALIYQGTWNASTNTPTLTSGTGTKGYLYKVSVAGTTTLDGISTWNVGDSAVFDGTYWEKIDGISAEVLSVNGYTGAVSITGTTNQITVTGNVFSIATGYIGQTSITTLGTITSGVWNGTAISNSYLANSSLTVNGTLISLGSSGTVTAAAGTLTGTTLNSTVVTSSLTSVGTLSSGTWHGTTIGTSYGGTGVTSVTTAPTASSFAGWDSNSNLSANNFNEGYATTVTSAGNTYLTVSSAYQQNFTGTNTQDVYLPVTSTLTLGQAYMAMNQTNTVIEVFSSGSNQVLIMQPGSSAIFQCISTSGASAASWNTMYFFSSNNVGTLINTRVQARVATTTANTATYSIETDNYDIFRITGQSTTITGFTITGASPADGDMLLVQIKDSGTAVGITWGSSFESSTVTLPTTTVASTLLSVQLMYNYLTSKWRCMGYA